MVLETAINGRADCIVTFNTRHFAPATRFGIETIRPDEALRKFDEQGQLFTAAPSVAEGSG
jgi:hypothetical protein